MKKAAAQLFTFLVPKGSALFCVEKMRFLLSALQFGKNFWRSKARQSKNNSVEIFVLPRMRKRRKFRSLFSTPKAPSAWLNALYTEVYEYSGKYSNQVAWERFTEYMIFYDEVVDYNNELALALYDVYYAYAPATEEEAALCVDDVIQIAEESGAEIQIW